MSKRTLAVAGSLGSVGCVDGSVTGAVAGGSVAGGTVTGGSVGCDSVGSVLGGVVPRLPEMSGAQLHNSRQRNSMNATNALFMVITSVIKLWMCADR